MAMLQGHKKPSEPVTIERFSGTFKKGGSVKRFNQGALVSSKPVEKESTPTPAEAARMRKQVEEQRAADAENKGYDRFKREILPSQMNTVIPKRKGGKVC